MPDRVLCDKNRICSSQPALSPSLCSRSHNSCHLRFPPNFSINPVLPGPRAQILNPHDHIHITAHGYHSYPCHINLKTCFKPWSSDHFQWDLMVFAAPAPVTCTFVSQRGKRFPMSPVRHVSTLEWYHAPLVRIPLPPISGAGKLLTVVPTYYRPRLLAARQPSGLLAHDPMTLVCLTTCHHNTPYPAPFVVDHCDPTIDVRLPPTHTPAMKSSTPLTEPSF